MLNYNNMNNFGRVLTTCIYDKLENGLSQIPVYTEEEYLKGVEKRNTKGGLFELVGLKEYQVTPYFDIDAKGDIGQAEIDEDIEKFENDLENIVGQYTKKKFKIFKSGRPPRDEKGKLKYSCHFYVEARISYYNIPIIFKELFDKYPHIRDKAVYNTNQRFSLPVNNRKRDIIVPPLGCLKGSFLNCTAIYILEEFLNLDEYVPEPKAEIKFNKEYEDTEETKYDGDLNFNEIITKLKKERATEYNPWFYVGVALINLHHRKIFTRGQLLDLYDLFSAKSDNYSSDGVVKMLDINISRFNDKGYGIKYLLDCLKEEDEEYYKSITFKDMIIDGSKDDIGASQIVVEYYKGLLTICKGVLYVNYEDIWINNQVQVYKILINMIEKLDIMFYGADGKRKYHYNKSIKHIKDCIVCIKANQSIINDNFYDDMINNNKYYMPFKDCIYSFLDKKTYTYGELPNIHFTYKINRYFPKFNKTDHDDLMNKVVIPIYPDEEEQKYNAHIKARALAGCYHDKEWYGYGGSRNSG